MIFFNYHLKRNRSQLKYSISNLFRYTYIVILVVIAVSSLITGSIPIAGIIVAVVSLIALTYREEWIFDAEKKEARYQITFLLLNKANTIPFDDIHYFDLQRRNLPQPFNRNRIQYYLILVTKEGRSYEIGSDKVRYSDKIISDANDIAVYCDCPLHHSKI